MTHLSLVPATAKLLIREVLPKISRDFSNMFIMFIMLLCRPRSSTRDTSTA